MAAMEEDRSAPGSGMLSNLLRRIAEEHIQKTQVSVTQDVQSTPSPQEFVAGAPDDSNDSQASLRDHRQAGTNSQTGSKQASPQAAVKTPEQNGNDPEPHILLSLLQEPYQKMAVKSGKQSQGNGDEMKSKQQSGHNEQKGGGQGQKEGEDDDASRSFLLNLLTQGAYVQPGIASISPEGSPAAVPVSYQGQKPGEQPVFSRAVSDMRGYDDVLKHAKQMMALAQQNTATVNSDPGFHIVITPQDEESNDAVNVKEEEDEYTPEQSDSNGYMESEYSDKQRESSQSAEDASCSERNTPYPTVVALFKSKHAPDEETFKEVEYKTSEQKSRANGEDADFVQGYICKHCGVVHMTLLELKKHVAESHRPDADAEVCHPLDLSTERESDSGNKSPDVSKLVKENPMCCVCGKLQMTPEGRKVTLKNTFKLANKFYQKLSWVLGTPVSHMNKNFTKICLICLRKVKKVYFAQRTHKLLKQKFEVTKLKFLPQPEKIDDTRKQKKKLSRSQKKQDRESPSALSTLGQAYDIMIQQAMVAEEVIPNSKPSSVQAQSGRQKSNKIGALKSLLAATDVDPSYIEPAKLVSQPPKKSQSDEHCALKALLTGPALSDSSATKMRGGPLEAIQKKHTMEPSYEDISPSKRPRRTCRDRKSAKLNLSPDEAEELEDPTYLPKKFVKNRSLVCDSSESQREQSSNSSNDSQLRRQLGTIIKKEPSSPTPVAEVPHDVFGGLLNAAFGGSSNAECAVVDSREKIVKERHVEYPALVAGDLTEYRCIECNQQFYTQEGIDIHLRCHIAGSSELRCWECGYYSEKLPTQWRIIRSHLVEAHNAFPHLFGQFPCPVPRCSALFHQETELFTHFATAHSMPTVNTVYDEPRPVSRGRHFLSANGLFDFSCSICGTSLQSEDAMALHQRCHVNNSKGYQCFLCKYSHPSQPGSWRFMRGHLFKQHMPDLIAPEVFQYYECQRYSCRLRFVNINARMIHESCHMEHNDNAYFCYMCNFGATGRELSWEMVRDHLIQHHPLLFAERFQCNCGDVFSSYARFRIHEKSNA